jgi:hypothetical protein
MDETKDRPFDDNRKDEFIQQLKKLPKPLNHQKILVFQMDGTIWYPSILDTMFENSIFPLQMAKYFQEKEFNEEIFFLLCPIWSRMGSDHRSDALRCLYLKLTDRITWGEFKLLLTFHCFVEDILCAFRLCCKIPFQDQSPDGFDDLISIFIREFTGDKEVIERMFGAMMQQRKNNFPAYAAARMRLCGYLSNTYCALAFHGNEIQD